MKTHSEKISAAADPCSDQELLRSLADYKSKPVRRALAANPNTPEEILQRLWIEHPDLVLENPILALWDFSQPNSVARRIGHRALIRLYNFLRREERPLRMDLFGEEELADLIQATVACQDPAVFESIPFEEDVDHRLILVRDAQRRGLFRFFHEHAPDAVWLKLASDPSAKVRLELANLLRSGPFDLDPWRAVLEEACRLLARDRREEIVEHLANCRFLPVDLIEDFSLSENPKIRAALARCKFAPSEVLRRFVYDTDETVRLSLAKYSAHRETLLLLVRDPSEKVRKTMAENHSTPADVLNLFEISESPAVLRAVFRNPQADLALKARLLELCDPEFQQVLLVIEGQLTPAFYFSIKHLIHPDILARFHEATGLHPLIVDDLSRDPNPQARLGVVKRLRRSACQKATNRNVELVNRFAFDPSPDVRLGICADPRLGKDSTKSLLGDSDPVVRKKTMRSVLDSLISLRDARRFSSYESLYREKAPLLCKMATDSDHAIRIALASCQEAPPAALGVLFDDSEPVVASEARGHDRWPFGVVLDLEKNLGASCGSMRQGHTTPSAEALQILATSKNPYLRNMVAKCTRTKIGDLRKLADDPHPIVRASAEAALLKKVQ